MESAHREPATKSVARQRRGCIQSAATKYDSTKVWDRQASFK